MKKAYVMITGLLVCLCILVACKPTTPTPEVGKLHIKFDGFFTQTGPASSYGIDALKGVRLAIEEYNADPDSRFIAELIDAADDACKKEEAVALFKKKAINKDVLAIFSAPCSHCAMACHPLAEQYKIPYMILGSGCVWPTEWNDWTFRGSMPDDILLEPVVKMIVETYNPKTLACFYDSEHDPFPWEGEAFPKEFAKYGVETVAVESFKAGGTDFRAQLTKITDSDPDLIALLGLVDEMGLLASQAREMGLTGRFTGLCSFNAAGLWEASLGAIKGGVSGVGMNQESKRPATQHFVALWNGKYPDIAEIPGNTFFAYDATKMMLLAAEMANTTTDREAFCHALGSIKDFEGAAGTLTYLGKGDCIRSVYLFEIGEGGEKILIE